MTTVVGQVDDVIGGYSQDEVRVIYSEVDRHWVIVAQNGKQYIIRENDGCDLVLVEGDFISELELRFRANKEVWAKIEYDDAHSESRTKYKGRRYLGKTTSI